MPFKRPEHLAPDVKSELVIEHALRHYASRGEEFDAVMMLQPTSPFRSSASIDKAIDMLASSSSGMSAVMSAKAIEGNRPEWMFRDNDGLAVPYVRKLAGVTRDHLELVARQDLEPLFKPDGSIFLALVEDFLRSGNLVTSSCGFFLSPELESFDIDTELDLRIAEALLS